jgi:hypothetical protein
MRKLRRNMIVMEEGGVFYGRIIRSLPNNEYLWLCSGLHFRITSGETLHPVSYKGYFNAKGRFVHMTTLRNLKRMAQRYHGKNAFNTPLDYQFIKRT